MADSVQINGGKSAVEVAHTLFNQVVDAEGKRSANGTWVDDADRKYILDTFSECLQAARGLRAYGKATR